MIDETIIKRWMLENNGNILYDPMHPGVFTGYVTFTPERSKSALENNTRNRKLKANSQLPILMEAMENGEWDDNVETISFTKDNILSNGQHRFESSVRSGSTFRNLVTYGISDRAQRKQDRGASRKLDEDLYIDGFKNTIHLAAIIRVLYFLDVKNLTIKNILNRSIDTVTVADSVFYDYFYEHKNEIIEKERFTASVAKSVACLEVPGGIVNVLSIKFDRINKEDAKCFWERLSDGFTTIENDPIIVLRNKLIKNKDNNQHKLSNIVMAALIIKTWNLYMKGETTQCLKFAAGGATPESFPEIYNPYLEGDA